MKIPWTLEEAALLIIFDMWKYERRMISEILTLRSSAIRAYPHAYPRTTAAVDNKLRDIRCRYPELWSSESGWNMEAVVAHLHSAPVDHELVHNLLTLSKAECAAILSVSSPSPRMKRPRHQFLTPPDHLIIHSYVSPWARGYEKAALVLGREN